MNYFYRNEDIYGTKFSLNVNHIIEISELSDKYDTYNYKSVGRTKILFGSGGCNEYIIADDFEEVLAQIDKLTQPQLITPLNFDFGE